MQYISLLELNSLIKATLKTQLAPSYWVVAEVSEMRVVQRGHCYLELIEKENDFLQAKLRATIWTYDYRNICSWFETVTGQPLSPGMKVLAKITVDFHELYGLSANIKEIDPQFTLGERARKKQEVIDKLVADGIFDMNKQLTLPYVPQNIAIISSPTAAGYGDFMHQLQNNEHGYSFSVKLFSALMQGGDAPASIIEALYAIHREGTSYDLVAIIRGGGAQTDMDCFDDYELASHVAQFPIPIITGIGHERDESITDLVAHTKFKTPTAVSAFLISITASFEQKLDIIAKQLSNNVRKICMTQNYKLIALSKHFLINKTMFWNKQISKLDQTQYRILVHTKRRLEANKTSLTQISRQINTSVKALFKKEIHKIDYINNTLKLSDPKLILKKGYTISYIDNKLIKDATTIAPGKTMVTYSEKSTIKSIIQSETINHNGQKDI